MNFPAYVPAAVRLHITTLIEGDSYDPYGWAACLASAEEAITSIDRAIEIYTQRGEEDHLLSLRIQKVKAQEHRDVLAADVECLRRLGNDPRMREAFALLTKEFTVDQEWRSFISAAWAARMDFTKYRDRLKRTKELINKIAEAAKILASRLRELSEIDMNGPGEFYSVPELLRKTDNHEMNGHNLHMWRTMRPYILGDLPRQDAAEKQSKGENQEPVHPTEIVIVRTSEITEVDPKEQARELLRYAWGTAPEFSALLDTVAQAAIGYSPGESGMIGAAIESRKNNAKTAYVRAFGNLLTDSHGFTLNLSIIKAMAIVANVVINQPDVDVTYVDVRKALEWLQN